MFIIGEPQNYFEDFPSDYVPDILTITMTAWKNINPKVNIDTKEIPINKMLMQESRRLKNIKDIPFKIRPEIDSGEEGRIDIIWDYIGTKREEVYFAFECKRLRYQKNDKIISNASEYTGADGMMCFVSGKYSNGLTVGGMIGYVLDSNLPRAIDNITKSIIKKSKELKVKSKGLNNSSIYPSINHIRETVHHINNIEFKIHHLFLVRRIKYDY